MSQKPLTLANARAGKATQVLERLTFNLMLNELELLEGKSQRQIDSQIDDLIKIEKRYHRRKSELACKSENEQQLKVTYQALLKGDIPNDPKSSLSIARLALAGWNFQYKKNTKLNDAYRNAKTKLAAKGASPPIKHDEAYLLQALVEHYFNHYGVLPTSGLDPYSGSYRGVGFEFIFNTWQAIAESQVKPNTLGRYLDDEKCRISLIFKDKNY
jgi:hypothetical protein